MKIAAAGYFHISADSDHGHAYACNLNVANTDTGGH